MKSTALLAVCLALTFTSLADDGNTNAPVRIMAADAKAHVNATATVTGKVAEVNVAERLVRINFGLPYPKQVFTAVIFANKTNLFPEVTSYQGKRLEITGKISDFHGHPEVVLSSTNQLKVLIEPTEGEGQPVKQSSPPSKD